MPDEPAYKLEIAGLDDPSPGAATARPARRWIGIRFDCCGVYARIYRNRAGSAYEGRCPQCLRPLTVRIGPEGVDARFFRAE